MANIEKISFNEFISNLSETISIDSLSSSMDNFINEILHREYRVDALHFEESLKKIARMSIKRNDENFYGFEVNKTEEVFGWRILFAITGISHERYKNLINKGKNVNEQKILNDDQYLNNIIHFLTQGKNDPNIKTILFDCPIELNRLQLDYDLFMSYLNNPRIFKRLVENTYKARIANKIGSFIEDNIIGPAIKSAGFTSWKKGKLPVLSDYFPRTSGAERNPTIDFIIPDKKNPKIIIESSYQITSSSLMAKKPDANDSLYQAVINYRREKKKNLVFVNFIDGAGWIARGTNRDGDLHRLYSSCDFVANFKTLSLLTDYLKNIQTSKSLNSFLA